MCIRIVQNVITAFILGLTTTITTAITTATEVKVTVTTTTATADTDHPADTKPPYYSSLNKYPSASQLLFSFFSFAV